jgi:hypothetical protein
MNVYTQLRMTNHSGLQYLNLMVLLLVLALATMTSSSTSSSDQDVDPEAGIGIGDYFTQEWHVKVLNSLSGGNMLSLHCQSKHGGDHRDLGVHDLGFGADFSWTFNVTFWATTRFGCYMRTTNKAEATFDEFPAGAGDPLA